MPKRVHKSPPLPPHGPNYRAKQLNKVAALKNPYPFCDELCIDEELYVLGIHWTLQRYWRHEICANQAQAEQKICQIRYLQCPEMMRMFRAIKYSNGGSK